MVNIKKKRNLVGFVASPEISGHDRQLLIYLFNSVIISLLSILYLYLDMSPDFLSSSQGYENVPMYIKVKMGG